MKLLCARSKRHPVQRNNDPLNQICCNLSQFRPTVYMPGVITLAARRPSRWRRVSNQEWSGVWLSEVPLDINEDAEGDTLLRIEPPLPEQAIDDYEWVEEGKPFREWLIPAPLINERALACVSSTTAKCSAGNARKPVCDADAPPEA